MASEFYKSFFFYLFMVFNMDVICVDLFLLYLLTNTLHSKQVKLYCCSLIFFLFQSVYSNTFQFILAVCRFNHVCLCSRWTIFSAVYFEWFKYCEHTCFSGDTLLRRNDEDPLLNSCFKIKFQMYCQKKKLHINILQLKFQYSVTHVLIFWTVICILS